MITLVLAAGLAASSPANDAAMAIVATERAFAADTGRRGGGYSFRMFVAPNAVGLSPNPQTGVLELLDAKRKIDSRAPPPQPRPSDLRWWPAVAGASIGGDIGFTTGPMTMVSKGNYGFVFTVWEKQANGSWKYFFDGGPKTDGPSAMTENQPARILPAAVARSSSPEQALREVERAEARIARAATDNLPAAYRPFLTAYSMLMGSGGQPMFGPKDGLREFARRGKAIRFERLGARPARSADFVFTYGRARIDDKIEGGYARIWQKFRSGWRLVFDQVQVP